ncbi:lipase 3-like [Achroia grisella]|uniref:lipase 3-like n=1 Tax=Achroia grisella TaxID=688607 RepID=UPI0027D213EA|nr:lipase 3-like [Achroia grisella]
MKRYWLSVFNYNFISVFIIVTLIGKCDSVSINKTFISELLKNELPIFNSNTVPNLKGITNDYFRGLKNEDVNLNITQLLTKYGYPVEQHEVVTSDGYILTMFRIPSNGPPVFLMHGLLCSSDDFVTAGPKSALAYLLADAGYDVWLGNDRGNKHSRRHISLSTNDKEFWDFSWDEIGRFDLPAMIDYVLKITGTNQLQYIGHSQGTTAFFVLCSERPEYNEKITIMIALSAVAWMSHTTSAPFRLVSPFTPIVEDLTRAIGLYEVLPRNKLLDIATDISCGTPVTAKIFCTNLLFIVYGFDYAQVNATNLPVIYSHYPSGAATKQFLHYAQDIQSGIFRRYDYGPKLNLEKYNSIQPPRYPVERITAKVAIAYSDNDVITTKPDLEILVSKLPNVVELYRVPFTKFSHMDFIYARDVRKLLYYRVLDLLREYAPTNPYTDIPNFWVNL